MKNFTFLQLLVCFFAFCSCAEMSITEDTKKHVFFSSFESLSDTTNWFGIYRDNIVDEAPKQGGDKSVRIAGGCLIPHASCTVDISEECHVMLKCYGKNLSNGGSVHMRNDNTNEASSISISDKEWKHYTGSDTIYCPANSSLNLQLNSGGFAPSSMLVDVIEIIKIEI